MNTKRFSLQDLSDYQPEPTVRDLDMRRFFVNGYCNCFCHKEGGKTLITSLYGGIQVVLPNHLKESEIQPEIDRQVSHYINSRESAKDRAINQNESRRFVIKFGEKY